MHTCVYTYTRCTFYSVRLQRNFRGKFWEIRGRNNGKYAAPFGLPKNWRNYLHLRIYLLILYIPYSYELLSEVARFDPIPTAKVFALANLIARIIRHRFIAAASAINTVCEDALIFPSWLLSLPKNISEAAYNEHIFRELIIYTPPRLIRAISGHSTNRHLSDALTEATKPLECP